MGHKCGHMSSIVPDICLNAFSFRLTVQHDKRQTFLHSASLYIIFFIFPSQLNYRHTHTHTIKIAKAQGLGLKFKRPYYGPQEGKFKSKALYDSQGVILTSIPAPG